MNSGDTAWVLASAGLGLDVIQARAATLGHEVVDAFYVRSVDGRLLTAEDRGSISEALMAPAQGSG